MLWVILFCVTSFSLILVKHYSDKKLCNNGICAKNNIPWKFQYDAVESYTGLHYRAGNEWMNIGYGFEKE